MEQRKVEKMRRDARNLCARTGVKILPYGDAWWLVGKGVNRVISDLAGLSSSHLQPLPTYNRKN